MAKSTTVARFEAAIGVASLCDDDVPPADVPADDDVPDDDDDAVDDTTTAGHTGAEAKADLTNST